MIQIVTTHKYILSKAKKQSSNSMDNTEDKSDDTTDAEAWAIEHWESPQENDTAVILTPESDLSIDMNVDWRSPYLGNIFGLFRGGSGWKDKTTTINI